MGSKYREYGSGNKGITREERQRVHPIWRGVGFAFMVLIPIISYAGMEVFLEQNAVNGWISITPDMMAKQGDLLYNVFPDPMVNVKAVIFLVIMAVLYLAMMFISFLLLGSLGINNTKNDPFYVPPVRKRPRPISRRGRR